MNLWELTDLATPWSVHVAVTLRIAEHLDAGITALPALASAAHADPDSLHRLLRHLVSKGIFLEPSPGIFALNDAARPLLSSEARAGLDLTGIGGRMANSWSTLLSAVRTGRPAYHEAFGLPFWEDLEAHPDIAASFDALMGPAGHGAPDPGVLANPGEWSDVRTVVDVGGGTGALLAEILRAHPHLHGAVVDLPRTTARAAGFFQAAGLADRVTLFPQSFFDPLPPGRDLYLLSKVLSDWPDAEAGAILRRCADAARPNGRVIALGEGAPAAEPDPELLMLVLVGGKGRTLDDFRRLAAGAGLAVTTCARQASGRHFVECRPT